MAQSLPPLTWLSVYQVDDLDLRSSISDKWVIYTFVVSVCCVIEQVKSGQFRYIRPDGKPLKTFYSGKYSGLSYLSLW